MNLALQARKQKASIQAKNFDMEAQMVWGESDMERKRSLITTLMIDCFKYPEKAKQFRNKVLNARTGVDLDRLAGALALYAHGEYVV